MGRDCASERVPIALDRVLKPNQALAALVDRVLLTHVAERKRPGNRLERLDADRDANHWSEGAAESGGVPHAICDDALSDMRWTRGSPAL